MMNEPIPIRGKIWFPNLDGLRFAAFLLIFLSHSFYTTNPAIARQEGFIQFKKLLHLAEVGVDFFFVLSGYLITYLLLREEAENGKINILHFYARRFLRIWPLYYLCLFLGFVVFPFLKSFLETPQKEVANPLLYFAFLGNFDYIRHGLPTATFLGVFWSIAVVEQFYVVWPLLLSTIKIRRGWLFFLLLSISVLFRYFNAEQANVVYLHSLSALSDLAVGALAAWLCFRFHWVIDFFENVSKPTILFGYLAGFVLLFNGKSLFVNDFLIAIERVVVATFCSFSILEQNFARQSPFKMASVRLFSYWGKYTYGLYCLHLIVLFLVSSIFLVLRKPESILALAIQSAISLFISLIASWLSYHYFEKYFIQFKKKFAWSPDKRLENPREVPTERE